MIWWENIALLITFVGFRVFVYGALKWACWNHQRLCAQVRGIEPTLVRDRIYNHKTLDFGKPSK